MTERPQQTSEESAPLPPIEQHELRGEFWHFVMAQAARERASGTKPSEDVVRVNPELGLFVLCDGMGGHEGGREAALIVSDAIDEHLKGVEQERDERAALHQAAEEMVKAMHHARQRLSDAWAEKAASAAYDEDRKMDTTATAVLLRKVAGRTVAIVGHVGNSRVYLIGKDRNVRQLTEDQDIMSSDDGARLILDNVESDPDALDAHRRRVRSEMAGASDVDALSEEARMLYQYRNITMSVGSETMRVAVDVYPVPEGSRLALISDGVFENLGGARTEQAMSMAPLVPADVFIKDVVGEAQRNGHARPKNVITAHADDTTAALIELT